MPAATEDTTAIQDAVAYVIELYRELTEENGAPTLGTQNQTIDFILADPELRDAVTRWARLAEIEEATTEPPRRLPGDDAYRRIRAYLESTMEQPVFSRPGQEPGDRR
jgi:hypothetical protein